jgi:AraC-like DNA-binding protein
MSARERRDVCVIPDGCRDVIVIRHESGKTETLISPLYRQTIRVEVKPKTEWTGFRLRPGCDVKGIDMPGLRTSLHSTDALIDRIECSTRVDANTAEAVGCIKRHGVSVQHCAKQLGVSPRTLQRLLARNTRRSPSFWLRLARVRLCARTLVESGVHPEVAYECHYADQAHMCREIKKWFGVPPSELLQRRDLTSQLFWQAY